MNPGLKVSKVKLSTFSLLLTLIVTGGLFIGASFLLWNGEDKGLIAAVIFFFLLISGLLYGPLSISADDSAIEVRTFVRKQKIPIERIQSVELFRPGMMAIRVFGSGGYMGYWGIFRDGGIGKYVAYYGKVSDCFLVRMKNGGNYVLGCENPEEMVVFINSRITS